MSLAKGKGKNTQDKLYKVQVAPVSALEAAEGRTRVSEGIQTGLKARQLASQTHLTALILSPTQKQALNVLYTGSTAIQEHHFHAPGPEAHASQVEAFVLMAVHGLDVDSREEPGNRWSVRATQLSTTGSWPWADTKILATMVYKSADKVPGGGYRDMPKPKQWKHRWLLERKDSRSLYRQFSCMNGIKTTEKAHVNIDE